VSGIAQALNEQSEATKEIASNTSFASQGILEMDENVTQTFSLSQGIGVSISRINNSAHNTAQGSSAMNDKALELNHLSERLKNMVVQFKI
jgi:methyl-accepting chemotaxis protein